jgi:hypothetical protein
MMLCPHYAREREAALCPAAQVEVAAVEIENTWVGEGANL